MSVFTMPTSQVDPLYDFSVELEGVVYLFQFKWNVRDSFWSMTISDAQENVLLAGRKIVLEQPLLARFRTAGLPPGELFAVDTAKTGVDPGIDELGGRVLLLYYDSTEVGRP